MKNPLHVDRNYVIIVEIISRKKMVTGYERVRIISDAYATQVGLPGNSTK